MEGILYEHGGKKWVILIATKNALCDMCDDAPFYFVCWVGSEHSSAAFVF